MTCAEADQRIIWSEDFLIGIEELDYEHQRLIEDINKLQGEMLKHVDTDRIEDTLGSIHARMQAHFALEERVMKSQKYAYYGEHKAEHEQLLDEYTEFMTKFEKDSDLGDREAIVGMLRQWIVDHILISDKKRSLMVIGGKPT